jgi:16S rRNA (guanine527-N7)-methyltransferase
LTLTAAAFRERTGVSADILARLERYAWLVAHWQARINLVGPDTLADIWSRHMLDSAQLVPLLPPGAATLVDIGSGAGFPGLVIAIMTSLRVTLVESDRRKAVFLGEVSRETSTPVEILSRRAESVHKDPADVITARALAPLPQLLTLSRGFSGTGTVYLLPKGRHAEVELTETGKSWTMRVERFPSVTDPASTLLRLTEVTRA